MTKEIFIIDRIEDGIAVLECQATGNIIELPRKIMPRGAREGHMLIKVSDDAYSIDYEATQKRRDDIKRRLEKILGRPVK
ncbi:MAG: DUF3006 domain-containing protein [Defluviitaleaceae bacterium]|nr:DUF3006 domain-containing protein [Defluviitaleaceae bacterium]